MSENTELIKQTFDLSDGAANQISQVLTKSGVGLIKDVELRREERDVRSFFVVDDQGNKFSVIASIYGSVSSVRKLLPDGSYELVYFSQPDGFVD